MASKHQLSSTHTLASIPRPIDSANGRILASSVSSLSHSKKRKRAELAVSIDGEGVNIYSIESPRLISSYAVSPQTYFVAPPCSLYQRGTKGKPTCRFTYAVTKPSQESSTNQVLCLEEEIQQIDPTNPRRTSHKLSSTVPIIYTDIIPSYSVAGTDNESHDVVILQQDGVATCFSARLSQELWATNLGLLVNSAGASPSVENLVIEYAQLIDIESAKKGLLKSRDDVLAALNAPDILSHPYEQSQLLVVISTPALQAAGSHVSRSINVFAIQPRTSIHAQAQCALPQHLLTWALPEKDAESSPLADVPTYSLHPNSGILHRLCNDTITTYDLSRIAPRITNTLKLADRNLRSITKLSASLLLTASEREYTVYDTKYNSVQSSRPVTVSDGSINNLRKRKLSDLEPKVSAPRLLDYFAKLGLAVAVSGNELIALQVGDATTSSQRRKIKDTLLIDSIGKSADVSGPAGWFEYKQLPPALGKALKDTDSIASRGWSTESAKLDRLLEDDELEMFEMLFAREVRVKTNQTKVKKSRAHDLKREDTRNQEYQSNIPLEWKFEELERKEEVPLFREKALYALGKIFTKRPQTNGSSSLNKSSLQTSALSIKLFLPHVFHWLIITGQLTADLIQQALSQDAKVDYHVARGDIVPALVDFDPSLGLLHTLLVQDHRLDIEEIVSAIKFVIQSLDDSTLPQPGPHLVANGDVANGDGGPTGALMTGVSKLTNGDSILPNGDTGHQDETEMDPTTKAVMDDVEDEINQAIDTLETGLPIRRETLHQALTKLDSFPSDLITRTLRRGLSHHENIFLIHILRIELAEGGWTSRYIDVGPADETETDEFLNHAISVVSKILGCAVDALGMAGWLVASATDPADAVDELLVSLRAEISATLEGVHEATFLTGVLSEFLRYGYKCEQAGHKPAQKSANAGAKHAWSKGKVWAVQAKEESPLPMGLKINSRKVNQMGTSMTGQDHKKSQKDIAVELHKMVGKYSFERIRF